jgi:hypothetical protein
LRPVAGVKRRVPSRPSRTQLSLNALFYQGQNLFARCDGVQRLEGTQVLPEIASDFATIPHFVLPSLPTLIASQGKSLIHAGQLGSLSACMAISVPHPPMCFKERKSPRRNEFSLIFSLHHSCERIFQPQPKITANQRGIASDGI